MLKAARQHRAAGFALIATIWTLGLMTLLGTAVIVGARYRTTTTSSLAETARITLAAESAVNLSIVLLATDDTPNRSIVAKFPLSCIMPGGESALISLEDEDGKIDLNTSNPQLLRLLFVQLGEDANRSLRIVDRIMQFRHGRKDRLGGLTEENRPSRAELGKVSGDTVTVGTSSLPSNAFRSIWQLDGVEEVSPRLLRAVRPFITVSSGNAAPSVSVTSKALRRHLNLPETLPTIAAGGKRYTIRADVSAPSGARFIREALVSFGSASRPFEIREWRRGNIEGSESERDRSMNKSPACLQIG